MIEIMMIFGLVFILYVLRKIFILYRDEYRDEKATIKEFKYLFKLTEDWIKKKSNHPVFFPSTTSLNPHIVVHTKIFRPHLSVYENVTTRTLKKINEDKEIPVYKMKEGIKKANKYFGDRIPEFKKRNRNKVLNSLGITD